MLFHLIAMNQFVSNVVAAVVHRLVITVLGMILMLVPVVLRLLLLLLLCRGDFVGSCFSR
jgi:ABC-type molybdate transport system permease subunit